MAVHPLHILDPLAGQPQQCQPDGNAHLADDAEAVAGELEEQVVGFANRARQGVLDRRNPGVGRAVAYRFENAPPGWNRHGGGLSEIPLGGLLAERPRLALKRDAHRLRHATLNDQPPFAHRGPRRSSATPLARGFRGFSARTRRPCRGALRPGRARHAWEFPPRPSHACDCRLVRSRPPNAPRRADRSGHGGRPRSRPR